MRRPNRNTTYLNLFMCLDYEHLVSSVSLLALGQTLVMRSFLKAFSGHSRCSIRPE